MNSGNGMRMCAMVALVVAMFATACSSGAATGTDDASSDGGGRRPIDAPDTTDDRDVTVRPDAAEVGVVDAADDAGATTPDVAADVPQVDVTTDVPLADVPLADAMPDVEPDAALDVLIDASTDPSAPDVPPDVAAPDVAPDLPVRTPLSPSVDVPPEGNEACDTPGAMFECSGIAVCRFFSAEESRCESCESCGNLYAPCSASNECDILFTCFEGYCTGMCSFETPQTCGVPTDCIDIGHPTHGACRRRF